MSAPRVAVVGTINRDVVIGADGARHESLGGILYNALPLAALLEGTAFRVSVHGRLGAADRDEAIGLLAAFPAIDPSGLLADPAGTNASLLDYSGGGDRREEVRLGVAPLGRNDLDPVRGARAALFSMISGRDLELATLADLRRDIAGPLFLDVQALARTTDRPRRPRVVPDGPRWAALVDVVKGNEIEIAGLGGCLDDAEAAVAVLRRAGPAEILLTRAEDGYRRFPGGDGTAQAVDRPAVPCPRVVDPTGCGDSFLAGVVAGRLLGADAAAAAELGAFVAAEVAGLAGLRALGRLSGVLGRARRASAVLRRAIPDPTDPTPDR